MEKIRLIDNDRLFYSKEMEEKFFPAFWFYNVFGFEESPESVKQNIEIEETGDNVMINDKVNDRSFKAGKFSVITFSDIEKAKPRGHGQLTMVHGHGPKTFRPYFVDMNYSMNYKPNNGATYVVLSSFNCLQNPNPDCGRKNGITDYFYDESQNSVAAVATAASTLYRNYFMDKVNLLSNTPIQTCHGFAVLNKTEAKELKTNKFEWNNIRNYQIGHQEDCQVVLQNELKFSFIPTDPNFVNLIFAGSFNENYFHSNTFTNTILILLLESQIKLAIYTAWKNALKHPEREGSNKLFLPTMGVDNRYFVLPEVFCAALSRCVNLIEQSGLDVFLVCYSDNEFDQIKPILETQVEGLKFKETEEVPSEELILDKRESCFFCKMLFLLLVICLMVLVFMAGLSNAASKRHR